VTLTEGQAALYQAAFGDRLRLPLDHARAARSPGTAPLAHPLMAINIAIGQSTWASQRVKANLFYRGPRAAAGTATRRHADDPHAGGRSAAEPMAAGPRLDGSSRSK
jgi:hypothetical protein